MTDLVDERQLAAARSCVAAILQAGSTQLSVEELRAAGGVSRRTFHRWFPSKARAIRPFYADMTGQFTARLLELGPLSTATCVQAWREVVLGTDPDRGLRFFRLVKADPEYWSVFLEVLEDGERIIEDELGDLSGSSDPHAATVTAVAIVSSSRLALESPTAGAATRAFEEYLTAFSPPLLTPRN